jgi:hypothetical protein
MNKSELKKVFRDYELDNKGMLVRVGNFKIDNNSINGYVFKTPLVKNVARLQALYCVIVKGIFDIYGKPTDTKPPFVALDDIDYYIAELLDTVQAEGKK